MLRLLLDEHISAEVAEGLRRLRKNLVVISLTDWQRGLYLGRPDQVILTKATAQKLTLVTYDLRTIPPLLKTWADEGRDHGGVIFVDQKTIPTSNFGALIHALHSLYSEAATWNWVNRVCFLRR